MNSDGTNPAPVHDEYEHDEFPAWSPDGEALVWDSNRDGDYEIFKANLDKTGLLQLTDLHHSQPTTARPDSTKITFDSDVDGGACDLYAMSTTRNKPHEPDEQHLKRRLRRLVSSRNADHGLRLRPRRRLRDLPPCNRRRSRCPSATTNTTNDTYPAWSPEGPRESRLASNHDGELDEIFRRCLTGGTGEDLATNTAVDNHPSWGEPRIVFSWDPGAGGAYLLDEPEHYGVVESHKQRVVGYRAGGLRGGGRFAFL